MLGIAVGNKSTWMYHKRFYKFLVPVKMHWPSLLNILTYISLKVDVHPESHISSIYNRLTDVMLLKNLEVVDSFGRYGKSILALSDAIISASLGHIALNVCAFYA